MSRSQSDATEAVAQHLQAELEVVEKRLVTLASIAEAIGLPEVADMIGMAISRIDEARG